MQITAAIKESFSSSVRAIGASQKAAMRWANRRRLTESNLPLKMKF
jgi:hypothetical protein